jgi:hypothetical protein
MAEELKGRVIGGEGKVAEVDGGYFGGYVKPANLRENARVGLTRNFHGEARPRLGWHRESTGMHGAKVRVFSWRDVGTASKRQG